MTLIDWTSRLCEDLSEHMAQRDESPPTSSRSDRITRAPEPRPAQGGCFHVDLGEYGLHIMQDDSEALLWLLNAEGRTSGPVWCGEMTAESASAAADPRDRRHCEVSTEQRLLYGVAANRQRCAPRDYGKRAMANHTEWHRRHESYFAR